MQIQTGIKLQKLRKEHGFSQEELADQLQVSRQAVSKWERGETFPDTDNLICLAKLYKTSLDELLEIEKGENEIVEYEGETSCEGDKSYVGFVSSVTALSSVFLYCLLGGIWGVWHPAWIIFLSIPIASTFVIAVESKSFTVFAYPCFIVSVYLCFGCIWGIWHPTWAIFLTIPIYYVVAGFLDGKR